MNATFYENAAFARDRDKIFGNDEGFRRFQEALMYNPRVGAVIQGTGGARKVRFAPQDQNRGKSGGIRVIYLYIEERAHIVLMAAYAKNTAEDLTPDEKKAVARAVSIERERKWE